MRIVVSLFMLSVALFTDPAGATDYYVSTTGSNSNAGTSLANPFLTIQQAANVAQAGDTVYVCGGTYRETVTMPRSGTANAPITFQPYSGQQVTITGLNVVNSGWTNDGGSIYSSSVGNVTQVFVNGQMMTEARSSNTPYVNPLVRTYSTVDSASASGDGTTMTITSGALGSPANGSLNGARMAIISGTEQSVMYSPMVLNQTGNVLTTDWNAADWGTSSAVIPTAGNRYYLYGSLTLLDTAKEWYCNNSTGRLSLIAPGNANPNGLTVEVRQRQLGLDLGSQSYINVNGFRLQAANIQVGGNHNAINNCQILYPTAFSDAAGYSTTNGVLIGGQYNTLSHCEVAYSWGDGVTLTGGNNTVSNNIIHDVDWSANDSSFVNTANAANNTITQNTMYNAGRSGIRYNGAATNEQITHNDVSRFGVLTQDLGGTYTFGGTNTGTVVAYNRIHDCSSSGYNTGIYLDNYSSGTTAHHNLIYNVNAGITTNGPASNENVYNNTLWGVAGAMSASTANGALSNINTYNNLSNNGNWAGTSVGSNLTMTADPFVNAAAGDYTLRSGTQPIDAGTVIPGITDGYVGSAPDVGAFEYGAAAWTAGANFKTWCFGNQVAAPLTAAVAVTPDNVRTTDGPLIAGRTGAGSSTTKRSFFKFDLSGVTGPIRSAEVRIYENALPALATGGVNLYAVTSSWDSGNVTYSQSVASTGTAFYDPNNLDLYTDVDVTSLVQAWINDPSSNFGFSLRSDAEDTANSAKYFEGLYGVTAPQLIITLPGPGDANGDGTVNGADLNIVLSNYNKTGMTWAQGDFDGNGTVNGADLNTVLSNYNQFLGVSTAVPEASSLLLAAAGLTGLLAFTWRKRK